VFKDHFSHDPARYRRFRPRYPAALFTWLAGHAADRERAWDCATGSGQAALGLLPHFRQVLASDASLAQLRQAPAGLVRLACTAERCPLAGGSLDLITVAQAAHWLDLDAFYREVRRLLRPGGLLALWCYGRLRVPAGPGEPIDRLYSDTLGPWWPPERRLVDGGYRDLPFPFAELPAPALRLRARWSLAQLLGYLGTWSALRRHREATGQDALAPVAAALAGSWGPGRRVVDWPLALRVGRV
jgi:SAM-dependent methyltransferase